MHTCLSNRPQICRHATLGISKIISSGGTKKKGRGREGESGKVEEREKERDGKRKGQKKRNNLSTI